MARAVSPNPRVALDRQPDRAALAPADKARYIRDMFAAVAPRYDLLNSILSFRLHHRWRRCAVAWTGIRPGDRCLDVCTGTGDFAVALAAAVGARGHVTGADFCEPMLRTAAAKSRITAGAPIRFTGADAERLPYRSDLFDAVTVGFGIRNVEHVDRTIRELVRVTRPQGRVIILEFTRPPRSWRRPIVDLYLFHVLPMIGRFLSRGDAYRYLPNSMLTFVSRDSLRGLLEDAGLMDVRTRDLMFGTVCIHAGIKR